MVNQFPFPHIWACAVQYYIKQPTPPLGLYCDNYIRERTSIIEFSKSWKRPAKLRTAFIYINLRWLHSLVYIAYCVLYDYIYSHFYVLYFTLFFVIFYLLYSIIVILFMFRLNASIKKIQRYDLVLSFAQLSSQIEPSFLCITFKAFTYFQYIYRPQRRGSRYTYTNQGQTVGVVGFLNQPGLTVVVVGILNQPGLVRRCSRSPRPTRARQQEQQESQTNQSQTVGGVVVLDQPGIDSRSSRSPKPTRARQKEQQESQSNQGQTVGVVGVLDQPGLDSRSSRSPKPTKAIYGRESKY